MLYFNLNGLNVSTSISESTTTDNNQAPPLTRGHHYTPSPSPSPNQNERAGSRHDHLKPQVRVFFFSLTIIVYRYYAPTTTSGHPTHHHQIRMNGGSRHDRLEPQVSFFLLFLFSLTITVYRHYAPTMMSGYHHTPSPNQDERGLETRPVSSLR